MRVRSDPRDTGETQRRTPGCMTQGLDGRGPGPGERAWPLTSTEPKESEMAATTQNHVTATAIRPFAVAISDDEIDDLRARIVATRFPEREPAEDRIVHPLGDSVPPQGVELATMEALMRYWGTEYDLRRVEARLNDLPQFLTEIDGLDIHFIHVKSRHENALPAILIHGWPGSVVEMLSVVGPLTDPTAHGGSAEDAFDVVIPSMPGYGFSAKPTSSGW